MRARKRFGQHFLEPAWVTKVVAAFAPAPDADVVEIGPGRGALTLPLAARVGRLLAVEVDRDLAAALEARHLTNLTVITADVLEVDLAEALAEWRAARPDPKPPVRVIGNLPYNISSPILFRLLDLGRRGHIADATLMLQAEVADRLVARPGAGEYGVLTVLTALQASVTRVLDLPPGAFRPMPKVRSAVVTLTFRPSPVAIGDPERFIRLVRGLFTQRRKVLTNALRPLVEPDGLEAAAVVAAAGLDGRRRPETLQLAELSALAAAWQTPAVL
jgi:16S rRNA (adenine1518-N6/adenine1519-N6)-dimethyltransferase